MSNRKLTHEEFINRIEKLYPEKFTFLEEYNGRSTPIKTMFNACGHIQEYTPGNLLSFGRDCPICNSRKKSHEDFVADVEKRYSGEYKFLSEYNGASKPIHVLDLVCGLDWWTTPNNIYTNNVRHPDYTKKMYAKSRSLSHESFLEKFSNIARDSASEYEFLDEYENTHQTMHIRHTCGCEYSRRVSSILYEGAYRCPRCFPECCKGVEVGVNDIHTTNPYLESILLNKSDAFKYAQYSHDYAYFVCPICGEHLYKVIANVSVDGLSCIGCGNGMSFGEKFIVNFLRYFDIDFEFQFSPDWANNRRYDLQFDISGDKYILEVDGGWHNSDNNLSGVTAEEQREIDAFKDEMAIEHGFKIIRFDYDYSQSSYNKENFLIVSMLKDEQLNKLFTYDEELLKELVEITKTREVVPQIVFKVAEAWNSLENKNLRNLKKLINYNDDGMREALYKASEIELIQESREEIIMLNRKAQFTNGTDTRAHYAVCDQTGEILNYSEAREKYRANLCAYFKKDGYVHTGKLPDGTKLTWHKYDGVVIK